MSSANIVEFYVQFLKDCSMVWAGLFFIPLILLFNGVGWLIFIPLIRLFRILLASRSTANTNINGENGQTSLPDVQLVGRSKPQGSTQSVFYNCACKSKVCTHLETSGPNLYNLKLSKIYFLETV